MMLSPVCLITSQLGEKFAELFIYELLIVLGLVLHVREVVVAPRHFQKVPTGRENPQEEARA